MKRKCLVVIGLMVSLSLTACGGSGATDNTTAARVTEEETTETIQESELEDDFYGGNDSTDDTGFDIENLTGAAVEPEPETYAVIPAEDVSSDIGPEVQNSYNYEYEYQNDIQRLVDLNVTSGLTFDEIDSIVKDYMANENPGAPLSCVANVVRYDDILGIVVIRFDQAPWLGEMSDKPTIMYIEKSNDGGYSGLYHPDTYELTLSDLAYLMDDQDCREYSLDRFGEIPEKVVYNVSWQDKLATTCKDTYYLPDDYTYEQCMAALDEYCKLSGISIDTLGFVELRAAYDEKQNHLDYDYLLVNYYDSDGKYHDAGIKISQASKSFVEVVDYHTACKEADNRWE